MPRSTIADPLGFFVLRAPLFPFDALAAFGVGLSAPLARPEGQDAALAQDRARSREKLRAFVALPEVREALFVASPSLEAELPMWIEAPETERGVRIEHALVRYVVRMTARATPFGLFAGCALGEVGPRTRLALDERSSWRRHTRFDMEYLTALAERLARDPAIRPALRHRPNSSLYRAAGRLRFAEARHAAPPELSEGRDHREGDRSYHLVAVEPTPYLQATVERSGRGARPGELAAALAAGDEEVSGAEAAAYVEDLIDAQLLQPEILPAVTGPEPVRALIDTLRTAAREGAGEAAASSASALEEARAALEAIDADGLGAAPARYHAVAAGLRALPLEAQLPRLFQVDMVQRSGQLTLGGDVIAEMLHALDRLRRTTAREDGPLHRFRLRFAERYQGRTVPLVEALDDEAGIGFEPAEAPGAEGAPLLETLRFPAVGPKPQPFEKRHAHLLRRLQVAWCAGERELRLDEADWTALERTRGKQRPQVRRHPRALEQLRPVREGDREGRARVGADVLERPVLGAPYLMIRQGRGVARLRMVLARAPQTDQSVGVGIRQRLQEHGGDDAEKRRVGADAQRQRHDRHQREPRSAAQRSLRVSQVLGELTDPAHVRDLLGPSDRS